MADTATKTTSEASTPREVKLPVLEREKLVLNKRSYHWITEQVCGIIENKQPAIWWALFIPSVIMAVVGVGGGLIYLVTTGVGVWGNTNRVMWGWPIVNFVFKMRTDSGSNSRCSTRFYLVIRTTLIRTGRA